MRLSPLKSSRERELRPRSNQPGRQGPRQCTKINKYKDIFESFSFLIFLKPGEKEHFCLRRQQSRGSSPSF